jgi:hypothetical protein
MRVNLFGLGTKSKSWAITAQKRINCIVEKRGEEDRTSFALLGRPGLLAFNTTFGSNPSRGMWAVNTLAQPLLFTVHAGTLYSINNAGVTSVIGAIGTITGDVSMADDGKYLVLVDGTSGYWYNMETPGALTLIVDGNFTTSPKTVSWQDNYFIVTSGASRQFQLSQITPSVDPAVWPAIQINFAGSAAGSLVAGQTDHSLLVLFGDVYTEFWQDTGSPDFPYANIPGSSQEFGLASAWSLAKFDNSLAGLFKNKMGGINVARLSGFNLQRLSDSDMEQIFDSYSASAVGSAQGYSFMSEGHPLYVIMFPDTATWMYDGLSGAWTELQDDLGGPFIGKKFAVFQGRLCVSDAVDGKIYEFDPATYSDNGALIGMEIWTKHIWNDDKYIGISDIQIDIESGVGLATGQGSLPVMDMQVSKDGGNTFASVGFSSMGPIGEYTQRVKWRSLGSARDWVLKLRITDPVKRVITGASAELTVAGF